MSPREPDRRLKLLETGARSRRREEKGASSAWNVYKRIVITQDGSREPTMTGDAARESQHVHRPLTMLIQTNEALFAPSRLNTNDLKLFCSHHRDNSSVNERLRSSSKLWRVGKCWKFPASCAVGCWTQMYPKSLWQRNVLCWARGTGPQSSVRWKDSGWRRKTFSVIRQILFFINIKLFGLESVPHSSWAHCYLSTEHVRTSSIFVALDLYHHIRWLCVYAQALMVMKS